MTERVFVVVPALNEQDSIGELVMAVLTEDIKSVIVVDNGSSDETAARARASGASVVSEPRRGYGRACAAGSDRAIELGATIIVYIDADLSSDPRQMQLLVEPIVSGEADLVLGSRTLGDVASGSMPHHQRAGNALSSSLMRRLYRIDITDLGPYRAIRATSLEQLDMSEMTSGWPTEMIVKAAQCDLRIREVPVTWSKRYAGESKVGGSLLGSMRAGFDIIRALLKGSN